MYRPHVVGDARCKYSGHMDAVAVWCSATPAAMNDSPALPPATIVPPPTGSGCSLPVAFPPAIGAASKEASVIHALAVIAATISTIALLVMLSLTVFVVSLAVRADGPPNSHERTTDT
jgi:hypothetical protein